MVNSYTLYSIAMIVILCSLKPEAMPKFLPAAWSAPSAVGLWFGYNIGLIAASGVCLPSFYFYSLLAGVKISMVQITGQVLKGSAATGVMLLGVLPIYVAIIMGMIVLDARPATLEVTLYYGLALPALAGLWGVRSIYLGAMGFSDTLTPERRCRRTCFLRRLTLAWAGIYTAVMPVMVYKLWEIFAGIV